ncbi:MAG: hypothetical protein ACOC9Z_05600 [Chloroflexota bacterium]
MCAFGSRRLEHLSLLQVLVLSMLGGHGPGWLQALLWIIIPVGIGNMLGGGLLMVLPFWFALRPEERSSAIENAAG